MLMSQGSLGIFFSNTLVATLVLGGFALLLLPPLFRLAGHRPPPATRGE
jgi:TctA family transporter